MMRENNRQVSEQVDKLVRASDTQAKAAADFALSAEGINSQSAASVKEFQRMAKASETSIQATRVTAQQALTASINASRSDQRAWIGVYNDKTAIDRVNHGDSINVAQVSLWVRNSGKTPALNVNGFVILTTGNWDEEPPDYDNLLKTKGWTTDGTTGTNYNQHRGERYLLGESFVRGMILAPGADGPFVFSPQAVNDNTVNRESPKDHSTMSMYVLGAFAYDDIFGVKRHTTKWCFVQRMPGDNWAPCQTGQWMD
jgi:hypothetical protein